jgi:hypothetical protein
LNSEKFDLIEVTSRSVLIDDSFNLGKAEYINQTVFLDIVKYLVNETSSMPFEAALSGMYFVEDMISTDFESTQLFKVDLFLVFNW